MHVCHLSQQYPRQPPHWSSLTPCCQRDPVWQSTAGKGALTSQRGGGRTQQTEHVLHIKVRNSERSGEKSLTVTAKKSLETIDTSCKVQLKVIIVQAAVFAARISCTAGMLPDTRSVIKGARTQRKRRLRPKGTLHKSFHCCVEIIEFPSYPLPEILFCESHSWQKDESDTTIVTKRQLKLAQHGHLKTNLLVQSSFLRHFNWSNHECTYAESTWVCLIISLMNSYLSLRVLSLKKTQQGPVWFYALC